jgi:hypothetical protein
MAAFRAHKRRTKRSSCTGRGTIYAQRRRPLQGGDLARWKLGAVCVQFGVEHAAAGLRHRRARSQLVEQDQYMSTSCPWSDFQIVSSCYAAGTCS